MHRKLGRLLCAATFAGSFSLSATIVASDGHTSVTPQLGRLLQSQNNSLQLLIAQLFSIAPDGQLTAQKLEDAVRFRQAARRAQGIQQVLLFDLDGDFVIDADEVQQIRGYATGRTLQQFELALASSDIDRDGTLSHEEFQAIGAAAVEEITSETVDRYGVMQMDADGDGIVTTADIVAFVAEVKENLPPVSDPMPREFQTRPTPSCDLPQPSDDAEVIFLSAYESGSLSTTAVSGRDDVTEVMSIVIEQGDTPLFLVSTTFTPMIFVFEGATDRVEQHVGVYRHGGLGVVGLDSDRITFQESGGCVSSYFTEPSGSDARVAVARLTTQIGAEVDQVIASYKIGRTRLPSGAIEQTLIDRTSDVATGRGAVVFQKVTDEGLIALPSRNASEAARRTAISLMRFSPSGITDVPADAVVASGEAISYDVLPQEAGLLQLVESGALTVESGRARYRIVEEIPRFPAGLSGAHGVEFFLAEGVPMPGGSPGHSSVVSEETGECLSRSPICR